MTETMFGPEGAAWELSEQNGGHWGEHPDLPVADWQHEVANGDTRLGYWEWVAKALADEDSDADPGEMDGDHASALESAYGPCD